MKGVSARSWIGLNAVNFFLAELAGVIMPFLGDYLKEHDWSYQSVGLVIAAGGLGTAVTQIPAGIISDRVENRRLLLAVASILLGVCYGLLPPAAESPLSVTLLVILAAIAGTFFVPLLAALALSLVGHRKFDHAMGVNQGWNHAGNIASALLALWLTKTLGIASIFYVTGLVSAIAASSLLLIRKDELTTDLAKEKSKGGHAAAPHTRVILRQVRQLLSHGTVQALVISVMLFHFANAPVMPLVGLYLKHLGGGDDQVAKVVLIAQIVMIPVALLAGKFCASRGRKPVFAIAFLILPIRIFLYALTTNPHLILAIQALDGIGAGIYGVVIALICADLTHGKEGFNTLLGIMQTALAIGGVLGPCIQGFLTQHFGFPATFIGLALIAAGGCIVFLWKVPETKGAKT